MGNEPWSANLLDALAVHLAENGHDLKKTMELSSRSPRGSAGVKPRVRVRAPPRGAVSRADERLLVPERVMNFSERDPIDEVVADLRLYFDDNLPVELWWSSDERQPAQGYISAIEDNYVVLARLSQTAWLNGFHAVRFTEIKEVLPLDDDDDAFLARAMEARGVALPPQLPVRATTLEGLLSTLCNHFPMIVVQSDSDGVGGTILRVDGHKARMRLLSRQGRWLEEEHELDLSLVEEVWFGSNYERVLERIGSLLDGESRLG